MKLDLDTLYEVKREIFRQMASTSRDHVYGMALAKRIVSGMIEDTETNARCGSCGRLIATTATDDGKPEGCTEQMCQAEGGDKHIPWIEENITLGQLLGDDPRCGMCQKLLEQHSPEERRACTEKFLADPKNYRLKP